MYLITGTKVQKLRGLLGYLTDSACLSMWNGTQIGKSACNPGWADHSEARKLSVYNM